MPNSFDSLNYVNSVVEDLIYQYNRACQATTPGLIGGSRETAARDNFKQLLPNRIGVGTGCVIDTSQYTSKQTDIILYEKDYCPSFCINNSPEATYFPCEGVIAVGELKSTLDSLQLNDSFEKIKSVKQCTRYYDDTINWRNYNSTTVFVGTEEERYNQKSNSKDQIYGFILCKKFGLNINTLMQKICEKSKAEEAHLLPNLIISLEDGMIFFVDMTSNRLTEDKNGATGVYYTKNNNKSIQFLLHKLYNQASTGRSTERIPFDKYLISTTKIDTDGALYMSFH